MIVDCTMFHWEFDILELRLRELYDTVDYFFITESKYDHRGNERKLILSDNMDRFLWAKDKIVVNVSDKSYTAVSSWDHEKYQRLRSVADAIKKFRPEREDFFIISDVDEIPRSAAIKELSETGGRFSLHMPMYYYYLNLYVHDWTHPKALSFKYMEDPNDIRTGGADGNFETIYNAGWHFSYLGNEEQIQYKIKTFAHSELDIEDFTKKENIKKAIDSRTDLFNRFNGAEFYKQEINNSFPEHVLNNLSLYNKYILK